MSKNNIKLEKLINSLENKYSKKIEVNHDLSRKLVSFQANKEIPGYRWYKFKEGYSLSLVNYVFNKLKIPKNGTLIDPFAGSGTSLFAASQNGMESMGIELLPVALEVIETRKILFSENNEKIREKIREFIKEKPWKKTDKQISINEINITRGAYSEENKSKIEQYLGAINSLRDKKLKRVVKYPFRCTLCL